MDWLLDPLGRLVAAIDGPVSLTLFLGCCVLAAALWRVWVRWETETTELQERIDELQGRVDRLQEDRLDDARQQFVVLSNTSAVLGSLERQARTAWERENPMLRQLDEVKTMLQQQRQPQA
jgi:hypothetical protein